MGKEFTNLTWEDLCDMMCGKPEEDMEDEKEWEEERVRQAQPLAQ